MKIQPTQTFGTASTPTRIAHVSDKQATFFCTTCKKDLPISLQYPGRRSLCRECRNLTQRKWRASKKAKRLSDTPTADVAVNVPPQQPVKQIEPAKGNERRLWVDDLFEGYGELLESVKKDASGNFRDTRMQILWILHNHYIKG